MTEKTLVLIKPDAVERNLIGNILIEYERNGLKILDMKLIKASIEVAEKHYAEHTGKPFFAGLVEFITSGPIVAMIVEGENAIKAVRTMMGATNPLDSMPGTIRGDFALALSNNVIHGSDGPESAVREMATFFTVGEIF